MTLFESRDDVSREWSTVADKIVRPFTTIGHYSILCHCNLSFVIATIETTFHTLRAVQNMRRHFYLAVLSSFATLAASLWPEPLNVTTGHGVVWHRSNLQVVLRCGLDDDASIIFSNDVDEGSSLFGFAHSFWGISQLLLSRNTTTRDSRDVLSEAKIFRGAVRRTLKGLDDMKFVPWKFHHRGSSYEPDIDSDEHSVVESFIITQTRCPSDRDILPC